MRREGFELQVSKPQVILREIDGVLSEPFERVQCEVPSENAGAVIESWVHEKVEMLDMMTTDNGFDAFNLYGTCTRYDWLYY